MRSSGDRTAERSDPVELALQKAVTALQSGRLDDAYRVALKLTGKHPKHAGANQFLGMTLLAQGRPGDAVAPLELAARTSPGAVIETYLAVALRKVGRRAEAVTILQQAIERQPFISMAFYELATLLCEQRRVAEAVAVLDRGMTVAPSTELSLALGTIYLDRGRLDEATAAFARVLATAPAQSGALHGLGCALMARGEYDRACSKFEQAIASNPRDTRAQLLLASCLFEVDKADLAMRHLRTLLATSPELFGGAVKVCVEGGRGRLWLEPSVAAESFGLKGISNSADPELSRR